MSYRSGFVALVGKPNVGKSTLVNALLGGARQATSEVRDGDQRGRHTTVAAELLPLPDHLHLLLKHYYLQCFLLR